MQRLPHSARLLVALSGGLDSTVLLHWLSHHGDIDKTRLHAMHIHHGLHADADRWAIRCQHLCSTIRVPMQVVHVDVGRDGGEGLEASARKARYAAFATAIDDDDVLVTAHHRDDQAETFLLRALRASGPDGLSSMRPWRHFGGGWHWRPLLDIPRSALLAYALEHALEWFDDPSNADTVHDRNFVRQEIMPLLRQRWPQVDAAFARSAALSADAVELLAADDASALASAGTADRYVLHIDALKQWSPARRARVLRRWVAALGLPPLPAAGIARLESQLLVATHDTEAEFAWSGARIRRWRDLLHADMRRDPLPMDWRREWDGTSPLELPTGDSLCLVPVVAGAAVVGAGFSGTVTPGFAAEGTPAGPLPAFVQPWVAHARQGGERITQPGRSHSHRLKHVLQDLGVPPWVRERLPLLSSDTGELHAIGDFACSATFDAWLSEQGVRLQWIRAGR
ncbi:MAG: tRNA lysidine(34) synthetase TilS [Luteimonas sp.]